jgi:hypothetical protein
MFTDPQTTSDPHKYNIIRERARLIQMVDPGGHIPGRTVLALFQQKPQSETGEIAAQEEI